MKTILYLCAVTLFAIGCNPNMRPDTYSSSSDGGIDAAIKLDDAAVTLVDASVTGDAPTDAPTAGSKTRITDPNKIDALADYIDSALHTWRPSKDDVFYASVAFDIATVVSSEPAIWVNDVNRSRTATLLATLAFFEGGMQRWVDDGTCNNAERMRAARVGWAGACDGGIAVSLWQIHPEMGFVLLDAREGGGWRWGMSGEPRLGRAQLLESRQTAARVALHIARQSIDNGGGLCQYSGEAGPCPKADLRLGFAKRWSVSHPF